MWIVSNLSGTVDRASPKLAVAADQYHVRACPGAPNRALQAFRRQLDLRTVGLLHLAPKGSGGNAKPLNVNSVQQKAGRNDGTAQPRDWRHHWARAKAIVDGRNPNVRGDPETA
eukprot:CAMPEP_0117560378 /NCGR_PEP_ID=MMETSP0784-20121206/53843_1 /TAXON_ID=39447 /ORGANISM="" /LENGTH=113 /DNA_ID=CAMNT_0005357781 /DNA_START=199 /DNA_END=536 /DNA_ORIENTATION=-